MHNKTKDALKCFMGNLSSGYSTISRIVSNSNSIFYYDSHFKNYPYISIGLLYLVVIIQEVKNEQCNVCLMSRLSLNSYLVPCYSSF